MRGADETSGSLFSYVDLEARIPARHPLRLIRRVVNDALASLDAEFEKLYATEGRPSIPPERLIRASLLQILFSVRSERQLMERMDYKLMFRWFVGLGIDDAVWVPTVFTKNRDRLLTTAMARKVMAAILAHREVAPLLSDEHFSVDGTLIKARASMKGFDSADFVADLRQAHVTPHVAQKARHSAIDRRTTRHPGYALSQKHRKTIEERFGWAKTVGGMAQTVYRGLDRVRARFTFTMAACNLARLPKLLAA